MKMKVLIMGMRGLGVEVAKNLILAGPAAVTIVDENLVTWGDLAANFYCRPEDVGTKTRAAASITKLQELNPYVKVTHKVFDKTAEFFDEFNVVVYTDTTSHRDLKGVNEYLRSKGIGFIYGQCLGAAGFTFLDYGTDFVVTDADGEETKQFIVVNATQSDPVIVTVHEDKRHKFQDGDYVQFREVQGMTELNHLQPTQIDVIDGFSFKVKTNGTGFNAYTREGIVENIKVPKKVSYHSFGDSIEDPVASSQYGMLETPDLRFFGRSEQLHLAIHAILNFVGAHNGRLPDGSETDYKWCLEDAHRINKEHTEAGKGLTVEKIDEEVLRNTVQYSRACISPMAAFFGGVIAQEIVKYTGKYSPLKQWLHYDIFECLPKGDKIDRAPMNCRYDDQIIVFGREV
jgi:ubiquitin-activating enzyme E1